MDTKNKINKKLYNYYQNNPFKGSIYFQAKSNICLAYKIDYTKTKRQKLVFYIDNNIEQHNFKSQYSVYKLYFKSNKLKEMDLKYKAKNFKEMAHMFLIHILCLNYLRNISYNNMLHSFAFNSIAIILLTLLIIEL
jgi:hypothetical protein